MISVKGGTQTYSASQQVSSLKPDSTNTMSALDQARALGEKSLGEVLNKVADPNWVDPAKLRKVGDNQLDKDAFLKLMLAQMKHQDPTNPMQSHEMAAQLAQFTSLEQLNNINTTLEGMKTAQQPATNFQALNFIGKVVSGDSSKVMRVAGDTQHTIGFELANDAANAEIKIMDAEGKVVKSFDLANLKKGQNEVTWQGLTEDGVATRPGEYRVTIEAKGSNGGRVFAKTAFEGRITGVNYTAEGPVLLVGNRNIRLSDAKKIVEPSASSGGANVPGLPLEAVKNEAELIPPAEESKTENNMESVAMASETLNKVAKAGM